MAALTSISKTPQTVKDLFMTQENDTGIYVVKLYIRGKPWLVEIDDTILVEYTQANWFEFKYADINMFDKAFWPIVLEKVWAKIKGSYDMAQSSKMRSNWITGLLTPIKSSDSMHYSSPVEVFNALLGVPTFQYEMSKQTDAA